MNTRKNIWHTGILYPLILTFIMGMIVGANYIPGTLLSGWDTLHPEFNLPLAFSRAITGVWRMDQGLGTVAAHSHMADLPHLVILWFMSLILPLWNVRYAYTFLGLGTGIFGMYFFIRSLCTNELRRDLISFIGALVYLTNLGTVQQFIVPFEMFTTEYALLPWILLTATQYLKTTKRIWLFAWIAVILLAAPMAYAATLWYAFFGFFVLYLALAGWKQNKKQVLTLVILTIVLNLYWLLPNIYFVSFHGAEVQASKVNRLFSPEAYAKNQEFGTIANLPLLKNFLFDWQLYDYSLSNFTAVTGPWEMHLTNPLTRAIGYGIFIFALFGVVSALKQKRPAERAIVVVFLLSGLTILNGTWPMTVVFTFLGTMSGVAKEALRFPFTKFSVIYMVSMSTLAALGFRWITTKFSKHILRTSVLAMSAGLLFYFIPAFSGNFIQPAMRITIPKEYTDMFGWFQAQPPDGRVAILPIHSFWNWTYYTWGFQGAGFLQFGIPQPILDRDYERWNPANEQYGREMSYAVYSQNPQNIHSVLVKYNVTWVLVDNSVFSPASNENQTLLWLMPELLEQAGLTKAKSFGKDITIYQVSTVLPAVAGFAGVPPADSVIPYSFLVNREERITGLISGSTVQEFTPASLPTHTATACSTGTVTNQPLGTSDGVRYSATDTPLCDHIDLSDLPHSENYVVEITSKHRSGFPLQLCISNALTSHCDVYVHLGSQKNYVTERFLLPALNDYGIGYSINLNNYTIRGMTSVNDIKSIRVLSIGPHYIPIPQSPNAASYENVTELSHVLYRVTMTHPSTTLALWQTFERGWIALKNADTFPYVQPVGTHIVLNDWANGWTGNFGTSDIIYIIFWPQLLEWVGFAFLPIGMWIVHRHI
jgi:hypothetical protein